MPPFAFATQNNAALVKLQENAKGIKLVSRGLKTITEVAKSPQMKTVATAFAVTGVGAPIAVCIGIIALTAEAITLVEAYNDMKDYMNELAIIVQEFFQVLLLSQQFNTTCQIFLQQKDALRALYSKSTEDLTSADWTRFDQGLKQLAPSEPTPDVTQLLLPASFEAVPGNPEPEVDTREPVPTLTPLPAPGMTSDKETVALVLQFLKLDPTLLKQIQEILDKILMTLLPYFKDTLLPNILKIYEFNHQTPPPAMLKKINKILENSRTRYFQNIGKWLRSSGFASETIPKINELLTQANVRFTIMISHQKTMTEFLEQHLPKTEFDELMQLYYMHPDFLNFVYFNNSGVNDALMAQLQLATFKSFMHHRFVDSLFTTPLQDQLKTLLQLEGPMHNVADVQELYLQRRGLPYAPGKVAEEIKKMEQAEGQRAFLEARMLNLNKEEDVVERLKKYKTESEVSQRQYLDAYYSQARPSCNCSPVEELDLYIKFETLNKLPKLEQLKQMRQETPVFKKIYEYRKNLTCNPCNYDELIAAEEKLVADRRVGEIYRKMKAFDKGSAEYIALEAQLKGLPPAPAAPVAAVATNERMALPFNTPSQRASDTPASSVFGTLSKLFTGKGGRKTKKRRARKVSRRARKRLSARASS